MTTFFVLNSL